MSKVFWMAVWWLAAVSAGAAQAVDEDAGAALRELSARAAVVFAGQVLAVRPVGTDAAGIVEISFQVDVAVRGVREGQRYTLREWAGLWAGQEPRFHVGERLLMLLPAVKPGGLSAPVGGMDGAIPLRAVAAAPLKDAQGRLPRDTGMAREPKQRLLESVQPDLRWVRARAMHTAGQAKTVAAEPGLGAVLSLLGAADAGR